MDVTYLKVFEETGQILVEPGHADSIDAAVTHFMETGRDSLLHLTTVAGEDYVTRASNVLCWVTSTPAGRLRSLEFEKHNADERAEARAALGLPYEDPE